MSRWYRIFAGTEAEPQPADLLQHLRVSGFVVESHFQGDERGWFRGTLSPSLLLERYLADEDGIRAELNTWAAWLETQENNRYSQSLMTRMITTRQLFTLHLLAEDVRLENLCRAICQFLARHTDGVYQIDDVGFFAADGECLVQE